MHTDPHAHDTVRWPRVSGETPLSFKACSHGIGRGAERNEEGVTLGFHLDATRRGEGRTQDSMVVG